MPAASPHRHYLPDLGSLSVRVLPAGGDAMRQSTMRTSRRGSIPAVMALVLSAGFTALSPAAFADASYPDSPTSVSVVPGNATLSVSWSAPADNGSAITGYSVTADDGVDTPSTCNSDASTTTCVVTGLTNATAYAVTVTATNDIGTSDPSSSVSGTPAAQAPSTVSGVLVTSGAESASVSWSAPSDNGASITGYVVTADNGTDTPTTCDVNGTTLSCNLTGLTNGIEYSITVTATNGAGMSSASIPVSVTPAAAPDAPTAVSVVASDGALSVSWSAPSTNGATISGYAVNVVHGSDTPFTCSAAGTASSCEVAGLVNGTTYAITVTATNSAGVSSPSTSIDGTPATTPGAPTDIIVAASSGSLSVSWSAPSDGGSSITGYTVTAAHGSDTPVTCTTDGSSTTCDLIGLTNGTAYLVSVSATNAMGTTNSDGAVTGTPAAAPSEPTDVSVVSQNGSLLVSWSSAEGNGATVTSYTITLTDGIDSLIVTTVSGSATSTTITGLTNGTTYSVIVTATNSQGEGSGSTPQDATPATTPGAPTDITVTPSDHSLSVSWSAPSNGGSDITGYTVTADNGVDTPSTCTTDGTTSTCDITELTNGSPYSVSVSATNAVGTTSSAGSVTATPATTPDAPTSLSVTTGNGSLIVTWDAPTFDGGASILSYVVSADNGVDAASTCTVTDGSNACTITGLTNGTDYSVTVTATNAQGGGTISDAVTGTPSTVPDAPTAIEAISGDSQITVNWTAPDNTGGSDITMYTATAYAPGYGYSSCNDVTGSLTCDITELYNGVDYTVTVVAINAQGASVSSGSDHATPAGSPTTPSDVTVTAGNGQISVSWSASDGNGSAITAYTASTSDGSSCDTTSALSCVITGLTNGTSYSISVVATNGFGDSASSATVEATPATVPTAPRWLHGVAGNSTATLLWNASTSNGGAHIDAYNVSDLHGHGCTTSALTCTVTGLTNGTTYTFYVTAHNVMGNSAKSNSNIVIPLTTPSAPAISTWRPGNHQVILTVTPPTSNGGKPYYYEYSVNGGVAWASAQHITTGNTVTIGVLTNGTAYRVAVRAVNQAGHSTSSNVVTATPSTVPLAPIITSVTLSSSATVIHIGALSTGGSAITAVQYSLTGGTTWTSVAASASTRSITIAAVALKRTVNIVLRAVNANGPSPSSVSYAARRLK